MVKDSKLRIGISDYAQDQLGDIVFVEMPEVGDEFERGDEFGILESVKAVSELYMPVSGRVLAVNDELQDEPELLNQDPYENWIIVIEPADMNEVDELLDSKSYYEKLGENLDCPGGDSGPCQFLLGPDI